MVEQRSHGEPTAQDGLCRYLNRLQMEDELSEISRNSAGDIMASKAPSEWAT